MNFGKNPLHDFPKMRGGVNGGLELFRKFIRFWRDRLPLWLTAALSLTQATICVLRPTMLNHDAMVMWRWIKSWRYFHKFQKWWCRLTDEFFATWTFYVIRSLGIPLGPNFYSSFESASLNGCILYTDELAEFRLESNYCQFHRNCVKTKNTSPSFSFCPQAAPPPGPPKTT